MQLCGFLRDDKLDGTIFLSQQINICDKQKHEIKLGIIYFVQKITTLWIYFSSKVIQINFPITKINVTINFH